MNRSAPRAISLLAADVAGQDGARLAGLILLSLAAALAEGFGILSLVPVTALAVAPDSMADVPLIGPMLGAFAPGARLPISLAAFVALMTLRAILVWARGRVEVELGARYESGLKLRAVASLAERPWAEAARIGRGGMQALLHHDVPRSALALQFAIGLLVAALLLAVQVMLAAMLSVPMTLVALAVILAGTPFARAFVRRAHGGGRALSAELEQSTEAGNRLHDELKSAMAQGSVALFLSRYRASVEAIGRTMVGLGRDQAMLSAASGLSAALAAALLVWGAVAWFRLPLPTVLGLLLLFSRMSGPARTLVMTSTALAAHAPSFAAIGERIGVLAASQATARDAEAEPLSWSRFEIRGGTLETMGARILDRVDLGVAAGEWVAVEGPSGAGKTSLLDMVAGLHGPGAGALSVDGRPLDGERLARWRRSLSYVGQDEMIFAASLRDNLAAGVRRLDPELLDEALRVSGLVRLAARWPEGLELPLADRGRRLSGGERQRVGIARALVRAPRLLILDEATAALDLEAEGEIFDRLRKLVPRPAVLMVSHRPQTLARCDRRVVLAGGRVV